MPLPEAVAPIGICWAFPPIQRVRVTGKPWDLDDDPDVESAAAKHSP
jgi:hypothetical protein